MGKSGFGAMVLLAACAPVAVPAAPHPVGAGEVPDAVRGADIRTEYVRLGTSVDEALLYEPRAVGAKMPVAIVFAHPAGNNFSEPPGAQLASRGYRVLMVNHRGVEDDDVAYAPAISAGIAYLRTLPGVRKVVVLGHSGGGHLIAFYANVAENGPGACQAPGKIYPCAWQGLERLARPDGMILLDPTLGAFHQMSSVDPAIEDRGRDPSLDMFAPANGYDPASRKGRYSPDFTRRFSAAQAARNAHIVGGALARLRAIDAGQSPFSDDEPLVIRGMGVNSAGARLYQPDTSLLSHTKAPHLLLGADGSDREGIIVSVRPPTGQQSADNLRSLALMTQNTTVRHFLASSAIRTQDDFAITDDDILGVDWHSAMTSTPANAEGIKVPSLILTMSCHYLVVPGEIVFDHLAAKDKSYASVEGATHVFTPCRPGYGDTVKRTFDFVDAWLSKPGRF